MSASMYQQTLIVNKLQKLAQYLSSSNDDDEPYDSKKTLSSKDLDHLMRLIRPASNNNEFANAVKLRLRQKIVNHPSLGNESPLILNKFDKSCDQMKKLNPSLLSPFLMFLTPLSFYEKKPKLAFSNILETEKAFYNNQTQDKEAHENRTNILKPVQDDEELQNATKRIKLHPDMPTLPPPVIPSDSTIFQMHWVAPEIERKLLIDIVYILQGVSGKHIKYDSRSESYIIDPSLQVQPTVRDIVLCICELGWLFNRISDYLKVIFTGSTDSKGLVVQAFGFALQEELQDYYRLLAVLESELKKQSNTSTNLLAVNSAAIPPPKKATERELSFRSKTNLSESVLQVDEVSSSLTLLRLKAWMQEPTERMCLLARMVDCAQGLTGGALISRLHAFSRHGDVLSTQLVQRIMNSVCAPLYAMLTRWLLHGELNDPHNEFFIGMHSNSGSAQSKNLWTETYFLRFNLLPTFIAPSLATKILNIGKSINFMKLCIQKLPKKVQSTSITKSGIRKSYRMINKSKKLGLYGQVVDSSANEEGESDEGSDDEGKGVLIKSNLDKDKKKINDDLSPQEQLHLILTRLSTKEVEALLIGLRESNEINLNTFISELSTQLNAILLSILKQYYNIQNHLLALKKFMLLGQGDFITCLMDNIGPELKKRSNHIYKHNLLSIVDGALRASNAQYEQDNVLQRVNVRLLESSVGDTGWEIFSLDYTIDYPLNAIVHNQALSKYRIIFHMLWRLKRVEWSLTTTWKQYLAFSHIFSKPSIVNEYYTLYQRIKPTLHRCNLNRSRMIHIVNNLQSFFMCEVMENAWLHLLESFDKAKSLDEIIVAHDDYLTEIMKHTLLSDEFEELTLLIQSLLQIMLRFCHQEETLLSDVNSFIQQKKALNTAKLNETNKNKTKASNNNRLSIGSIASIDDEETNPYSPSARSTASSLDFDMEVDELPVIKQIDETVKEYSAQFDLLMAKLKIEGEKSGEILRNLTFRLDFNDYHELQKQKGYGIGLTGSPGPGTKRPSNNVFVNEDIDDTIDPSLIARKLRL